MELADATLAYHDQGHRSDPGTADRQTGTHSDIVCLL